MSIIRIHEEDGNRLEVRCEQNHLKPTKLNCFASQHASLYPHKSRKFQFPLAENIP